jgi:selenocysteine lyase/cysteine desulfurase
VLGAAPDEIAVTASASAGLNALASALEFSAPRNKVVVSDFEFPTNAQIWHAQEPRGACVVHVPRTADGDIPLESFARLIDDQTQLVAVTHVCFRNGARLDIPGIVRLAHARGARVLLDCYQAVGGLTVDVKKLDVDFAVGGMLKYLLGTAGIGFLYVRDSLLPTLTPTHSGWFAQEDIFAMDITANRPAPNTARGQLLCGRSGPQDHPGSGHRCNRGAGARAHPSLPDGAREHRLGERHAGCGRAAWPDGLCAGA